MDHYGRILSLKDAETDYEYAARPLNELRMYQDISTYYDAWEISRMYEDIPVPLESVPSFSWEEEGGRLTVYVKRREPHFTWNQKTRFAAKLSVKETAGEDCTETDSLAKISSSVKYVYEAPTDQRPEADSSAKDASLTELSRDGDHGNGADPSGSRTAPAPASRPAVRSYFSIEGSALILETCKPAMDVPDGVVVRFYEPMGMARRSLLALPPQVKRVWQCNMPEEKQAELAVEGGKTALRFHAFAIMTLLPETGSK